MQTDKRNERKGRFGKYGGQYVPETLMPALSQLEEVFEQSLLEEEFQKELNDLYQNYIGRPTPLYFAKRLTEYFGKAKILLKREDLNHTGAHKINNAIGQALLAKRLGKQRIIAETGAGQHGVATATACALLGLECTVFMGAKDIERQQPNVFRMKMLGAKVHSATNGEQTLKEATSEAIRDWVTNVTTTHYILGTASGPHPYPLMVREFQSIIGKEAKEQCLKQFKALPDYVLACIGGGSNAIGIFHEFKNDASIELIGLEAGGKGVNTKEHASSISKGKLGILHGTMSYLVQDDFGKINEVHSISAGMDYPGVGPEHSYLKDIGRAQYYPVTDKQALEGFKLLANKEGILAALESSHAIGYLFELMPKTQKDETVMINLSGRGDKDIPILKEHLG
ncbi:MAG: tryptophan synthase subunit beta [Candidatus Caenarcaniphilales bacterium]|nr:tryptophan synthase subunit beta [Candidatus Caenarcaniphilales bacterium]